MFRDDVQRGAVCEVLTSWIAGGPYWRPEADGIARPTDAAVDVRDGSEGRTKSERTMVCIAWDIWNGDGGARIVDALHAFDSRNLAMVGSLMTALAGSAAAIDSWLAAHRDRV